MANLPQRNPLLVVPLRQSWTVARTAAVLLVLSTVYLALPHIIFYVGWLRWPWATLATLMLVAAVASVFKFALRLLGDASSGDGNQWVFRRAHVLTIGVMCLLWLALAGVGGFSSQDLDWDKHNMVLNSLIRKPWPTVYEIYKVDVPLVYYIAFYLPAALVGKIASWFWANVALLVWSAAGLFIAILWFCILVRRVSYTVLLIFGVFSGWDVIGKALVELSDVWNIARLDWRHIDSWAILWQYSSNATLINWVPHQALGGWIVTGMALYCVLTLRRRELTLLPVGLSAFWSPFVTVGMLPYLVLDFLLGSEPWGERIRRTLSLPNLAGLGALAITGFYFSAKAFAASPIAIQDPLGGWSIEAYDGPAFEAVVLLLVFGLLEFGLYAIILYHGRAVKEEGWRWVFNGTVVTLLILPWFTLGVFNDLVMRASIPALFVLAVVVARAVFDKALAQRTRNALLVVLVIGSLTAGVEVGRHLRRIVTQPAPIYEAETQRWDLFYYMQRHTYFFGQYSGSLNAPFFQYAAKPARNEEAAMRDNELNLSRQDYILFGNQLYLLRNRVQVPPTVAAGATLTVPMWIHYVGPLMAQPYDPVLRLVDSTGTTQVQSRPMPEARPEVSDLWITRWQGPVTATVPLTVTPGVYALEVGFVGAEDGEYLMGYSVPDAEPLGERVLMTMTEVLRRE